MDLNKSQQEANSTYNNSNTDANGSLNNQYANIKSEPAANQNYTLNLSQSYSTTQTQGYASAYSTSLTQSQPLNSTNLTSNSITNTSNSHQYPQNENISQKRSANDEIVSHKRPRITSKIDLRILLPSKVSTLKNNNTKS
jgi:hypothetical protein